ncbi:hypothetical protein ACB092_03G013000 [Castanea dentata]
MFKNEECSGRTYRLQNNRSIRNWEIVQWVK